MITSHNAALATYICSGLALAIILSRFFVVHLYRLKLDAADWLSVFAIAVIVARLIADRYLLLDGTANDALVRHLQNLSPAQLHKIKTGSLLALVARLLDTTFFWFSTAILLLFYSNLLQSVRWAPFAIKAIWAILAATYVAVVVVTFTECRPFHLYWQVYPNPGQCTSAYIQLYSQGSCNIFLDLGILVISIPLLRLQGRTTSQKVRITLMVSLGLICIIITCIRITLIVRGKSAQPSRTFFASIQLLMSAFVANMPTIYGRLQNGRRKKAEQSIRRVSAPEQWWTSRSTTRSDAVNGLHPSGQRLGLEEKFTRDSEAGNNQNRVDGREMV